MTRYLKFGRLVVLSGTSLIAAMALAAQPAAAQAQAQEPAADTPLPQTSTDSASTDSPDSGPEIVVTGSSIRGVPPIGSNLISVTREDIRRVGAVTTPDLLATVPQLNSFNTAPRAAIGGAGSFAPGLRSLPVTATLPLMNGHRLVAGGANQTNPDFPFIPDLAIERVEIVADGASSIYGSDAIAGVVNFITRKRANGVEFNARYGFADDFHSLSASALAGKDWGSGSILAAYQYSENGNITGADRRYRVTDFRPFGGVDARGTSCPAPNVTLNGVNYYAAPGLAANTVNYCDTGAPVDLVPASRLHSVFLTGRQELGTRVTLWGDLLYSDRKDTVQAAIPGQTVLLTAANPFFRAPPGTGTLFEYVLFRPDNLVGADHFDQVYHVKSGNGSAGLDVKLPGDFNLTAYGTYDWARSHAFQPQINPTTIAAAAAGTTLGTALDPFGTGTAAGVVTGITNYSTTVTIQQRTRLGAVKLDGPLLALPGGEVKIAAGAEYRRETFQQRGFVGTTQVPENLGRNIYSVYGELFVPIFGEGNATTLMHRLDLSLSGRYDHYSDFGSTSNPKIGVNWAPIDGLTFRGTYGRSFRAPGLRDVGATVGAYYADASVAAVFLRDPSRTTQVNTVYLAGGNRSLQPEKARTYSLGVDLRPRFLPGFSASATFYDINFTDVIGTPPTAFVFTDPSFTSIIYRNPTAAQLASLLALAVPVNLPTPLPAIGNILDLRQGNFGVRKTNGIDFDVNYRHATGFGAVYAGLAGNYILKFDTRLSPTAPVSNSLKLGVPKTTLRGTLGMSSGPVNATAFVNYREGITNTYATPTGTSSYHAGAYTTVDLRVSLTLPNVGLARGTQLSLQVNDLFDKKPPFFPATDGIGGAYNPIGRFVALNLRKSF